MEYSYLYQEHNKDARTASQEHTQNVTFVPFQGFSLVSRTAQQINKTAAQEA